MSRDVRLSNLSSNLSSKSGKNRGGDILDDVWCSHRTPNWHAGSVPADAVSGSVPARYENSSDISHTNPSELLSFFSAKIVYVPVCSAFALNYIRPQRMEQFHSESPSAENLPADIRLYWPIWRLTSIRLLLNSAKLENYFNSSRSPSKMLIGQ